MKKKLILIFTISILFLFSACGKTQSEPIPGPETEPEEAIEAQETEASLGDEEDSSLISREGMLEGIIIKWKDYLFAIDPNTGDITTVRNFTPNDSDVRTYSGSNSLNSFQRLQYYNEDLTKHLAIKDSVSVLDHAGTYSHIGWVNTYGEFEDITSQLESFENQDDYLGAQEPLSMDGPRNYRDQFIYAEAATSSQIYRIPYGELKVGGFESFASNTTLGTQEAGDAAHIDPTGILQGLGRTGFVCELASGSHEYNWPEGHREIEEDANQTMVISQNIPLRWLSKDSYLMARTIISDSYSAIYLCERVGENNFNCTAIAPYVEDRKNLSYAVSPDDSKVAFTSEKGGVTNLYIAFTDASSMPQSLTVKDDAFYELGMADNMIDPIEQLLSEGKIICWSDGSIHPQDREISQYLDSPECYYQIEQNVKKYGKTDN